MNTPFGNTTYSNIGQALRAVFEQAVGDTQRPRSGPETAPTQKSVKLAVNTAELTTESAPHQNSYASLLDGLDTEKLAVDHSTQNVLHDGAVDQSTRNEPHNGAVDQSTQNVLHRMIYTEEKRAERQNSVEEAVWDVLYDPLHRMNDIERSTRVFGRLVDLPLWAEVSDLQIKRGITNALVPRPAPLVPLQQPALQQQGVPQTLPGAGASPIAPTAPTMTGVPQKPIGLDRPQDTRAAAIPGTPGHAATNVIDQYGALDPRGLTVDGNNSAAVTKIPKMAALLPPVGAIPKLGDDEQEDQRTDRSAGGSHIPNLAMGLGGVAAGTYGLAQGLASDGQISRLRHAIDAYQPEAFTQGRLPPNRTGLTHYEATMSPAAQLKPFGVPVGRALVKLRSDPTVMKALGTPDYTLKTPQDQHGVSGLAHYNMFAAGPVPAYAHQVKARLADLPVPAELGAPAGIMYSDWIGRKLEDFLAQRTGQRINPFEVNLGFMPHDQQVGLMEQFHQSLSPEQQAFRMKAEDPGAGYANQVNNYLPKAETYANVRDTLKNVGITAGGAALGAAGGNWLHSVLTGDQGDEQEQGGVGRTLSTLAGAGLGGAGAYLGGTQQGRELAQRAIASWIGKHADSPVAAVSGGESHNIAAGLAQRFAPVAAKVAAASADVQKTYGNAQDCAQLPSDLYRSCETGQNGASVVNNTQQTTYGNETLKNGSYLPRVGSYLPREDAARQGETQGFDSRLRKDEHRVHTKQAEQPNATVPRRQRSPDPTDVEAWKAKGCGPRVCTSCGTRTQCRCPTVTHVPIPEYRVTPDKCPNCRGNA